MPRDSVRQRRSFAYASPTVSSTRATASLPGTPLRMRQHSRFFSTLKPG